MLLRRRLPPPRGWRQWSLGRGLAGSSTTPPPTSTAPRRTVLRIGDVSVPRSTGAGGPLVPSGYGPVGSPTQEELGHLRWMMQKGDLRQDLFLVGPPGPARRGLALWYAELLRREVETLQISRDTSESDLKQRRELVRGGDAIFLDQAPVRAAINGSLLVLDGLEKAERNVSRADRNGSSGRDGA